MSNILNHNDYLKAFEPITSRVRTDVTAIKKKDGKSIWTNKPLTDECLLKSISGGLPRGVCPMKEGESTTQLSLIDMDAHNGEKTWDEMVEAAKVIIGALEAHGIHVTPFRSSGGHGMHLIIIWGEPQDAYSVRTHLADILRECGYKNGTGGIANKQVEIFPKQNRIEKGGKGSQFILPLALESTPLDINTLEVCEKEYFLQIDWKVSKPVPFVEKPIREVKPSSEFTSDAEKLVALKSMLDCICSEDRDPWIKVGMALHYELNGSKEGLDLFHEWSEPASTYKDREDVEKTWRSFKDNPDNPVTIGTIKKLADEGGWVEDITHLFDEFDSITPVEKKSARFEMIQAADFAKRANPEWLIKNVLPKVGMAMVYGESGCGKTFFVLDFCLAISRGIDWKGHKVKEVSKVAYIAAEGVMGIRQRLKANSVYYDVMLDDFPFYLIEDAPNLHKDDHKELIAAIQEQGGADVVVIDTLAQVTPGANENSGEHMNAIIKRCQLIMSELNCLVVLVHHSGKDASRGSRGWSGMKGALDTEINIQAKTSESVAKITKQKDGADGAIFPFSLESVCIGEDEDGDPITSCVVKYLDDFSDDTPQLNGKWQKYVMDSVSGCLEFFEDEPMPEAMIIDNAIAIYQKDFPDNEKDVRKSSVRRALTTLVKQGIITIDGNNIHSAQPHTLAQMN